MANPTPADPNQPVDPNKAVDPNNPDEEVEQVEQPELDTDTPGWPGRDVPPANEPVDPNDPRDPNAPYDPNWVDPEAQPVPDELDPNKTESAPRRQPKT